ncbi:hypothetical protein [uncultured Thiodictyon sp.]|uniref:hypothetical protein n=1 Tax=uncultured Thiodictyon sp. TaxID=1846217 RepID=UPI0025FE649E|nr:hypothetical protein [uncultured Thiodictyon sp.]
MLVAFFHRLRDLFLSAIYKYDAVAAALDREATAAKKAKDWDRAITCLRKVNARRGEPSSVRLALYLQQAGRFDESMREFRGLVEAVEPTVNRSLAHATPNGRRASKATHLMQIYDKMALACRREKRVEDAARFAALANEQQAIRAEVSPLVKAERKKKIAEWRARWGIKP